MVSYLIKSSLCLLALLVFYHLFLEKEKMHKFNRFYLLGSVLFSFLVPFLNIYIKTKPIKEYTFKNLYPTNNITTVSNSIDSTSFFIIIYCIVCALFVFRFLKNLLSISKTIRTNRKIKRKNATYILIDEAIQPHSFWNYIFFNEKDFKNNKIEEELFTHEITHVTQKHTLDILLLEVLHIIFWFNPILIWFKKAIQLNHEFIADDTVINSHKNISYYQNLLLNKAAWNNKLYLASNLNYLITKKRLLMMKTQSSNFIIMLKKLSIIPLIVAFIFVFANKVEAQIQNDEKIIIETKEATEKQMKEYRSILKNAKKKKMFTFDEIQKLKYLYNLMTENQKKTVENVSKFLPPPPPKPIRIKEVKKEKVIEEIEEEVIEEEINKEIVEIIIEEEKEEVEEIIEKESNNKYGLDLPEGKNVTYFIDGKKASKKAVKKLKPNEIKSVDVIKKDGISTVKIIRK